MVYHKTFEEEVEFTTFNGGHKIVRPHRPQYSLESVRSLKLVTFTNHTKASGLLKYSFIVKQLNGQ